MAGWIKIHRRIRNHWLWADEKKLKWWLDILFTVNYEKKRARVGNKWVDCDRGQCVMSLTTWATHFRTTRPTVTAFFRLLENDNMILLENLQSTCRITVCNYESYQSLPAGNNTDDDADNITVDNAVSFTQLKNTLTYSKSKEEKEEGEGYDSGGTPPAPPKALHKTKEEKKADCDKRQVEFKESLRVFVDIYGKEMMNAFYNYWKERNISGSKMRWEQEKTWETKLRLLNWQKRELKWKKPAAVSDHPDIDPKLVKLLREEL